MLFVLVGVLLVILKVLDVGPVVAWSWWIVLSPFAGALAWWAYADWTGLTQRWVMQKIERRKEARRRKSMEALGLKDRDPR